MVDVEEKVNAFDNKVKEITPEEQKRLQETLPDPADPSNAKALRCNSCRAVVHEMYKKFNKIKTLRHGDPKHFEYIEGMEEVCTMMRNEYGLGVSKEKINLHFVHKSLFPTQASGHWVTSMIEQRCGEITDKYEDELIKYFVKAKEDNLKYIEKLCIKLEKSCEPTKNNGGGGRSSRGDDDDDDEM